MEDKLSKMKDKTLHSKGNPNFYVVRENDRDIEVAFRYKEKLTDGKEKENFNELNVLDFVATSYKNSCFCIIEKIKKGLRNKKDDIIILYLPLMFCFRHYLEMKLKLLYVDCAHELFDKGHKLSDLRDALKGKGYINVNIFDSAINYIESLENNYPEHFRYIVATDYKFTDKLIIPKDVCDVIFNYINHIETAAIIARVNSLSTNK